MASNTFIHRAQTRRHEDFGFMTAFLSFKPHFAPDRQRFGSLITIDDAVLSPGAKGLGFHSHQDVEVVTFLIDGEVRHIDPNEQAHTGTLRSKGIQIITAGTGIVHNEENHSPDEEMRALQIWFTPRERGLDLAYSKRQLDPTTYTNRLALILSPDGEGQSLIVQQDVWLSYALFEQAEELRYQVHSTRNGAYIFMIEGEAHVGGEVLRKGDAFASLEAESLAIAVEAGAELLVFDLSMTESRHPRRSV